MTKLIRVLALLVSLAACAGDAPPSFYNDVPEEPALTEDEVAVLPTDDEHVHHAELEAALAAIVPEADGENFDDDEVTPIVDRDETPDPAAYQPQLRYGLHLRASDALRAAGVSAWRITQTIGNAAASAGTHAQDGTFGGYAYSAATDISVSGLSQASIHNLLERLAKLGFAVWYRKSGYDGWNGADHLHAVYANAKMKSSLRSQVRSWLAGRNGLVSNTTYRWHTFSAAAKAAVKGKFAMSAEGTTNGGSGISGRVNTSGGGLTIRSGASTSASAIGSVADGAYVTITCQRRGESIDGTYGTTTLWDRVAGGYISDAYVATGSDGQVAPTCP